MGADNEITAFVPRAPARGSGALPPGTLLNGIYRIEERLGAGGMGEVYRAININNDEVDAIKIIGRGRNDQPTIEALFRREARVLARIRSPGVAQLKLFARDQHLDLLYFVTDFVPGESLLDRLRRQPAQGDELHRLLRRVLTGLAAVHAAGAIHRDLSPDNIILPGGDVGRATIIDFGIVKELDPSRSTLIGDRFAGKLGYIAPEQLGFSGAQIGPWTDLYSLALVGAAFAGGRPLDMGATMGMAEEARRRPPDLRAIPPELQSIFGRMLTYDWQARPQSAAEVLAMLDLAGTEPPSVWPPIRVPPPPSPPAPVPMAAPVPPSRPPAEPTTGPWHGAAGAQPSPFGSQPQPQPQPTWQGDQGTSQRQGRVAKIVGALAAVLVLLAIGGAAIRALWRSSPAPAGAQENLADAVGNEAGWVPSDGPTSTVGQTRTPAAQPTAAMPTPVASQAPMTASPRPYPTQMTETPRPAPYVPPQTAQKSPYAVATAARVAAAPPPPPAPMRTGQAAPPRLLNARQIFTMEDYPSSALRADVQGPVAVLLTVGSDGRVTGCSVTASSGNGALDSATCRIATARMRCVPGKDDSGNPITSTVPFRMRWSLPTE